MPTYTSDLTARIAFLQLRHEATCKAACDAADKVIEINTLLSQAPYPSARYSELEQCVPDLKADMERKTAAFKAVCDELAAARAEYVAQAGGHA